MCKPLPSRPEGEFGCTTSLARRWERWSPERARDLPKVGRSSGTCRRLLKPPGLLGPTASNVPSQLVHSVPIGHVL